MSEPFAKPGAGVSDDQVVQAIVPITIAFCTALAMIGAVGALYLVEEPTVGVAGIAVGVVLGLISWFVPRTLVGGALSRARTAGVQPDAVPGVVRTAVFIGIATAEVPALLALVLAVADGHEIGPLVIAVPAAIVSLVVNVSGPAAVRRHLATLRSPASF